MAAKAAHLVSMGNMLGNMLGNMVGARCGLSLLYIYFQRGRPRNVDRR